MLKSEGENCCIELFVTESVVMDLIHLDKEFSSSDYVPITRSGLCCREEKKGFPAMLSPRPHNLFWKLRPTYMGQIENETEYLGRPKARYDIHVLEIFEERGQGRV